MNLLTASTKMLNMSAVAKTELPKAPSTSARLKPKVLALCHLTRLKRTPTSPMIMETKWERTAKASERPIPAAPCPRSRNLWGRRRAGSSSLPAILPFSCHCCSRLGATFIGSSKTINQFKGQFGKICHVETP
uniref:Uncharacterized protein n=1 Tax=Taeniopygia guttata TaxID=59729 RepID=A0A674HEZ6_TAEGU